jgi:type IV pilus assembly protein PilY1
MFHMIRSVAANPWFRWLALPLGALVIVGSVLSQSSPPNIPAVSLSAEPLYARGARAKPTLTLALSVEFPTVGAQYLGTSSTVDNTYSPSTQYLGYFDTESCYVYNNAPTEPIPTGNTASDYKRFDRSGAATASTSSNPRSCGGSAFSGNFMNWASSSAIDILRYGLTGGDRSVDTATLTLLQRAVLPNTSVSNFWNTGNFPSKQISNAVALNAMPSGMLGTYTGTVYVANCLNRIHFGTAATGSCASPGANSNLGTVPAAQIGPITSYSGALPTGTSGFSTTACAGENGSCSFTGIMQVAYGAGTKWYFASATSPVSCSNGVFGDPNVGVSKACYLRADPTGWTPAGNYGSQVLTSDGFFYSRVSVCSADSSGNLTDPRSSLCLRYPAGNYKPVGDMQQYSDRLRVSVFGYLNDPTGNPNQRYGGVLRTPMKYVGPTYYDANFSLVSGTNPNEEWDPSTGILLANPDGNTTVKSGPSYTGPYLSGAINYLNQFGRTGIFGQYKTYDPVSELYYESLRYIQGLQPTPQATTGLTGTSSATLMDGFPVTTTWIDPQPAVAGSTDYSCVKNNIFTVGDIHTHNDASIPGNANSGIGYNSTSYSNYLRPASVTGTGPYPDNQPDFYFWMKVVGGFESGNSVTYLDGQGRTQTTTNPLNASLNTGLWGMENVSPSGDGDTYYMAGLAYWANTHDIRSSAWTGTGAAPRPGMRATTYMLDVNENGASTNLSAQHQNQFYLAAKYGGFNDGAGNGNPYVKVTNANGTTSIDNTEWAGSPAGTQATNYFLSSSASAVLAALNQIFAKASEQSNSIAGGAISTQTLSSVPGYIYQAQFDPSSWTGDVNAYSVSSTSSGVVSLGTSPVWQASLALASKAAAASPAGNSRDIVVGKSHPTSSPVAMPFYWANLDTTTQNALLVPPYAASGTPADPVATGQARLNYLRGDRSNEAPSGLKFRTRSSILGDIVNSGVVFSGAPTQQITDPTYATFYATNLNRKHALFVGANDGMLHAFDPDNGDGSATGGDELFAYIPSWVVPNLANLTSTSYVHQSYVDATPAVSEALVGSTWKTVLVGGTGGGGQGVFALDVTNPAAFDATKVMWEFTDADDPDMGNVIGRPQILKMRTSALTSAPAYKYFAVVASGVNNYVNDGHYSTGANAGSPAIFLLDLSKAQGAAWSLGTNYFKLGGQTSNANAFSTLTSMASGMVGFTALLGDDGSVAAIYAGDLQGNLWKVDFTLATSGTASWNLSTLSYFKNSSSLPMPMYVALDSLGNRQPITMDPSLVYGPNRGVIVSFGTGEFFQVSDLTNTQKQSVYAVFDNNSNGADSSSPTSAIKGRSRLAPGVVTASAGLVTVNVPNFVWGRSQADTDPSGVRSGWYFDFTNTGERQISDFSVSGGNLVFGSVIPPVSSCDDGSGYLYTASATTGDGSGQVSTVGILGQPLVTQVGNATYTLNSTTGENQKTTTSSTTYIGAGGLAVSGSPQPTTTSYAGRLSWREVTNYQCMKNSTAANGSCP